MPVGQGTEGLIKYFIDEHGTESPELKIPIGSVKPKYLPTRVRQMIKSTVLEAGWQVWRFRHKKCKQTNGITTFVIIRKPTEAPQTRDN